MKISKRAKGLIFGITFAGVIAGIAHISSEMEARARRSAFLASIDTRTFTSSETNTTTQANEESSGIVLPSREEGLQNRKKAAAAWKKAWFACNEAQANEIAKFGNRQGFAIARGLASEAGSKIAEVGGFAEYQNSLSEAVRVAADSARPYKNARVGDCIRESGKAQKTERQIYR